MLNSCINSTTLLFGILIVMFMALISITGYINLYERPYSLAKDIEILDFVSNV